MVTSPDLIGQDGIRHGTIYCSSQAYQSQDCKHGQQSVPPSNSSSSILGRSETTIGPVKTPAGLNRQVDRHNYVASNDNSGAISGRTVLRSGKIGIGRNTESHLISGSSWTGAMLMTCDGSSKSLPNSVMWAMESMTEDDLWSGIVCGRPLMPAQRHNVAGNIGLDQ